MIKEARSLWAAVLGRVTPAPLADRFKPFSESADSPDTIPESLHQSEPAWQPDAVAGRNLVIFYLDARGARSERQVRCRHLADNKGVLHLAAWCELRNQVRSFRVDRITEVFDALSGESLGSGLTWAEGRAPDRRNASGYRFGLSPHDYGDLNAALNVLAFVSRCDGDQHEGEIEAMIGFASGWWMRRELVHELDESALVEWIERLAPDAETFFVSLHRCLDNPLIRALLRRAVAQVINADDHVHDRETFWGRKIDDLFLAHTS